MRKGYTLIKLFLLFLLPLSSAGSSASEVLITINGTEITKEEFIHSYNRNSGLLEERSLNEFLEMFVDFKLKIADARKEGLHETPGFIKEISAYREKMARPYLTDSAALEKLAKEAYERLRYNVNASHILIGTGLYPSPEQTMDAYEKAMEIRERIIAGESFRLVAMATSDDPSVKQNGGNLGYFTALQMSYPFENFVYNSNPGDISEPVKTSFGYHIIRTNEKIESVGEVKTAHVMIALTGENDDEAREKIDDLHRRLRAGESFEELAREYSDDDNSAPEGGVLPWFGAGTMVREFEEAAFSLTSPGEFSDPVKTRYGWHIIKLIDRKPLPPYSEISEELKNRIMSYGGERERIVRTAFVNSLKREYNFREYPHSLRIFRLTDDEMITRQELEIISRMKQSEPLFSFAGQQFYQNEFAAHLSELVRKHGTALHANYIDEMYRDFAEIKLIEFENSRLEEKHPSFRYKVKEYSEGLLLYEITKKKVWSEISLESEGFVNFYEKYKDNYMWDTRLDATIFTASGERAARRTARLAERILSGRRDTGWLLKRVNRFSGEPLVTARRSYFSKGDSEITDMVEWQRGISEKVFRAGDNYYVVLVHNVADPEAKPLEMVQDEVLQDYQEYLEKNWLMDLRERYEIGIDRELLSGIGL